MKIKEVSYIHAEGFAAGELKHGVIALVESGTPCLVLAPDDETRTDVLSGAAELRSRGGHIIGVGSTGRRCVRRLHRDTGCRTRQRHRGGGPRSAFRLFRRPGARKRPRPAAQPGQERDGEVTEARGITADRRHAHPSRRSGVRRRPGYRHRVISRRGRSPFHQYRLCARSVGIVTRAAGTPSGHRRRSRPASAIGRTIRHRVTSRT